MRYIAWDEAMQMPECREKLDSGEWVLFKQKLPTGEWGYRVTDFGKSRAERESEWDDWQSAVKAAKEASGLPLT